METKKEESPFLQAKYNVLKKISEIISEKTEKVNPMHSFAMQMQTTVAINMYEEELKEALGSVSTLLETLENGNFVDENGSKLTDSITFSNLKKRLTAE